jgi:hypothetical protein
MRAFWESHRIRKNRRYRTKSSCPAASCPMRATAALGKRRIYFIADGWARRIV